MIIGAKNADPNGNGQAGQSYVVFGVHSGNSVPGISPTNTAPVAVDDIFTANQTSRKTILTAAFLVNDIDLEDDRLTITSVGSASRGRVTLNNDKIVYILNRSYSGTVTFTL